MKKGEVAWNKGKSMKSYPYGMRGGPTYVSWNNMKTRCKGLGNPKNKKNYLERGITYDPSWEYFENFLKDMGERPSKATLERIDNSKGYSKSNCKWASYSEQNKNRRTMSNTGHKHISLFNNCYVIHVKPFKHCRVKTLEEALKIKAELLKIRTNHVKFKENSMIPDQITYTKRHNEGNFSYSELSILASLDEGDDVLECFNNLKNTVHKHLGFIEEDKNQLPLPIEKVNKPVEKTVAAVEKPKKEVAVNNELKDEIKAEEKEKKTEAKAKKSAPETKPVKKISKATVYDRALDTHKNLLGSFLDKKYPKWRTSDSLKKAAEASKALNGTDFLDENGEILDSFKLAFSNYMDA